MYRVKFPMSLSHSCLTDNHPDQAVSGDLQRCREPVRHGAGTQWGHTLSLRHQIGNTPRTFQYYLLTYPPRRFRQQRWVHLPLPDIPGQSWEGDSSRLPGHYRVWEWLPCSLWGVEGYHAPTRNLLECMGDLISLSWGVVLWFFLEVCLLLCKTRFILHIFIISPSVLFSVCVLLVYS